MDVSTVQEIVASMAARFGKVNRVWVMDRGMVSAENIAWLNSTGRRYVIGTARAELKRWAKQIADPTDWRQIREDVEVKICRGPQASETFLLCRSASRINQSTRALDRGTLERQIGRLLERNTRAAARYAISIMAIIAHPLEKVKLAIQARHRSQRICHEQDLCRLRLNTV